MNAQVCSLVLPGLSFAGSALTSVYAVEFQGCCKACFATKGMTGSFSLLSMKGCGAYTLNQETHNCTLFRLEGAKMYLGNESYVSGVISETNHSFSVVWVAAIIMGITLIFWVGMSIRRVYL